MTNNEIKVMSDREKVAKAVEYLNWYFTQDDGTADENAVKAWEVLSRERQSRAMTPKEVFARFCECCEPPKEEDDAGQ